MMDLMDGLTRIGKGIRSFAFSAENRDGSKGGGTRGTAVDKLSPCIKLRHGETITIMDTDGPGEIRSIWFGGNITWSLIIRIYWDGQETPSVECPEGAFFGYGFSDIRQDKTGRAPQMTSAAMMVAPFRGLNCYWRMPFKKHCRVTVENRSPKEDSDLFYIISGVYKDVGEDCAYFHAAYRQAKPVPNGEEYTIIDGIRGTGHYVGTALYAGINGRNGCWVEGEAKMFIDGDRYPSINYTGTEDYFGGSYAFGYDMWGHSEGGLRARYNTYSGLYAGMYYFDLGGDEGERYTYQPRFMLYRWHIPDPVYFEKDFRMTLQNICFTANGNRSRRDDFASTAYWYQTLPTAPFKPLPDDGDVDMT